MPVLGPFETAHQLATAAMPLEDALRAVDATDPAVGRRGRANLRFHYLLEALRDTGVDLGNGDIAVARALAGATVETLVVVADWLARANAAGNVELLAEAAEYIEACRPGPGGRCEHGAWTQCRRTNVAWRLRGIDPAAVRRHAEDVLRND